MRKRIQKYQNSGVLTGGSNLTPPLPQPASLTSMIQTPSFPTTLELPDSVKQWNQNQASKIQRAYTKKANLNKGFGIAGSIADVAGSLIPKTEQSALTEGLNQGYDAAANAAMAIPGVGTIIGGAMKVGGMLSDGLTALGVGTDQMTTADKILDSKFLKLTPLGLVNAIGAKKADTITKDNEAFEQVGSSYGGTQATVDDALTKSGKKYGLLSGKARNKANQQIHNAQMQQSKMSNIADEAQMAFTASNNPLIGLGTQLQLNGGYQQSAVRAGKSGLKMDREFAKRVIKLSNGKKSKAKKIQEEVRMEEVAGFKNGGAVNVIPDGALHAHKHHLEDVDGKFEEVTTKGIPVITEEKGGDIKQHAEVEREEIIFNLDVTKQLEKLMQDGSDEAAIEAGKLLVHEILENTVDNTGLLKTVE
jgi:hypothetical protein|nr:MAG TPA: hypothetical protein [Caudoviricetes sp.]